MLDRLDCSSYPLRFGIALAALLLVLGAATESRAEATQAQCEAEWADSDADGPCWDEQITPSGDQCTISAKCKRGNEDYLRTSITVDLDSVSDLNNCNGTLTDGSC